MAIRRLEEYLSCKLFERSSKGIVLTEQARYLLPIATQIVELMDGCEAYFNSGQDTDRRLSLILTRGIMDEFAAAPINEFRRLYPNTWLELRHGFDEDCEDALDSYETELALTAGPLDKEKYEAEFIYSSRYGVVIHCDSPIATRGSVNIRDLDGLPLTVMQQRQKTMSVLKAAADAAGISLNIQARVDDALLTYHYAELKQAAGITTPYLAAHFALMNLRYIPFDDPAISWNIYVARLRDRDPSPAAKDFYNLVRQHRDNMLMDRQFGEVCAAAPGCP